MLALLLLAAALGLSNFAAAVGIGVSGVSGLVRVRIAVVFGLFEAGMPVLGLALGHGVAGGLGRSAHWLGGAVLVAIGVAGLVLARRSPGPGSLGLVGSPGGRGRPGGRDRPAGRDRPGGPDHPGGRDHPGGPGEPQACGDGGVPAGRGAWGTGRVLVSGAALSVDNLAAGFALGSYRTGLAVAATVFGVVSVIMSLAGLELGAKIGVAAGERSELIACAMLVAVGAAVAAGAF